MNLNKIKAVIIILTIITFNVYSQNNIENLTVLGQYRGQGELRCFDFVGNKGYLVIGDYLEIVDFSIQGKPQKLGEYYIYSDNNSKVTQIKIIGNYAYTNNGNKGMHILDISNPTKIRGVGSYTPSITKSAQGFFINQRYAIMRQIVGYGSSGFLVADLSDRKNPIEKGRYDLPFYSENTYLNLKDNFVYLTDIRYTENNYLGGDLFVIDISDPMKPKQVFTQRGDFRSSIIDSNRLFISDNFTKVSIFDITNPIDPVLIDSYDPGKKISSFAVSGNKLYVATEDNVLNIVDISDTSNITIINTYKSSFLIKGLSIRGKNIFISGTQIVKLLNTNDVNNIIEESSYNIAPSMNIWDIAVRNKIAFVTSDKGFYVIDISTKSNPLLLSSLYGISGNKIVIDSNYAYLARGSHDLSILDIKNPLAPKLIGSYDGVGYGNNLFIRGNYAYLAVGGSGSLFSNEEKNGIIIFDIKNKTNPHELSYFKTVVGAWAIYVDSVYAYIGTGDPPFTSPNPNAGLYIVDINDPSQPKLLSHEKSFGQISGVKVSNNYAFISKFRGNFNILDVSDPSEPKFISAAVSPSYSYGLDIENNFLYLASEYDGLRIYDFSDITQPKPVGFFNSPGRTYGVTVKNSIAYTADYNTGMYIIQNDFIFMDTLEIFTIKVNSDSVSILWQIKSGQMDSSFEIDRNDQTIASIKSHQNSNASQEYYYDDNGLPKGTYNYKLFQVLSNGSKFELKDSTVNIVNSIDTTKIDSTKLVREFKLMQNYPNPFNPSTTIQYSIKDAGLVSLKVFDVLGRRVKTLVNQFEGVGTHKINFDAKNLPCGIYFYKLESNGHSSTKKLILLR